MEKKFKNYIMNPKTKFSGIICGIPQQGRCPQNCPDCFYQSGRGYLDPEKDTPNLPPEELVNNFPVRVNDGHDSSVDIDSVLWETRHFPDKFYNTSFIHKLDDFGKKPVVLTLNPSGMTDKSFHRLDPIPENIMMVRIRVNTWNLETVVKPAIRYYTTYNVPVILTFMAYFETKDSIPPEHEKFYVYRKRTSNSYYAITTGAWDMIMSDFKYNPFVYSCGKIEGELGTTKCTRCGNCIREYFNTKFRLMYNTERK